MKAYTLLILFSFFQVLFCAIEGVTISKLNDAFTKSVPYMKAFHKGSFSIPSNLKFLGVTLNLKELTNKNVNFTIDEFDVLHIKFVNLRANMTGQYKFKNLWKKVDAYQTFKANLTNITFEQSFTLATVKNANGTYTLKYKEIGQNGLTFKVKNLSFVYIAESDRALAVKTATSSLKSLNFKSLSLYLIKLQKLILDTVREDLKKK